MEFFIFLFLVLSALVFVLAIDYVYGRSKVLSFSPASKFGLFLFFVFMGGMYLCIEKYSFAPDLGIPLVGIRLFFVFQSLVVLLMSGALLYANYKIFSLPERVKKNER